MKTVCELNKCNACMACVDACHAGAVSVKDGLKYNNAFIDVDKCINCNLCKSVCPNCTEDSLADPVCWYQGWANNCTIRENSSSGGVAASLTKYFIENGGYVCSCLFSNGSFVFECINDLNKAAKFSGSKYVKSNAKGAYQKIKDLLKRGESVLFIGLPCQSAALKLFIPDNLQEKLYRVDLICHGTPSKELLCRCLDECNINIQTSENIRFRTGNSWFLRIDKEDVSKEILANLYLTGFLKGEFYTDNCYNCKYASKSRISDITLGDSWGTDLKEEASKGVSLILVQTNKGDSLLKKADLTLKDVDIDIAIASNEQLRHPVKKTTACESFYSTLKKTGSFLKSMYKIEKKSVIKQYIKAILYQLRIYSP